MCHEFEFFIIGQIVYNTINCVIQKSKETGIIQIKMEIRKTATVLHICPSQMGLSGLSQ